MAADATPDQAVMLDPHFLRDADAPEDQFSAFILTFNRLGDRAMAQIGRANLFEQVASNVAPDLRRAIVNYRLGRMSQLVAAMKPHVGDPPGDHEAGRLQALHRLAVLAMAPVAASPIHVQSVERFIELSATAAKRYRVGFEGLLADCRHDDFARSIELDVLSLIPHMYELKSEFLPVLVDWPVEHPEADIPDNLQFGRIPRFDETKALYVDAYEAAMRAITLVSAVVNVVGRNDHNDYAPYLDARIRTPRSMRDFHRQNHAPKVGWVLGRPLLKGWPHAQLDAHLRNSIGHNRASLDALGERLTYADRTDHSVHNLSYANFLVRTLRALRTAHEANQLVRVVRAAQLLG